MLAGVIYGVQMRNSRRGRMAILTLDDGTARASRSWSSASSSTRSAR